MGRLILLNKYRMYLFSFALIIILVITGMFAINQKAYAVGEDTTAPIITSAKFSTPVVTKPGMASLKLTFLEQESGVKSVSITIGTENAFNGKFSNNDIVSIPFYDRTYYSETATFNIPVSSLVKSGKWGIYGIHIEDNAGNSTQYSVGKYLDANHNLIDYGLYSILYEDTLDPPLVKMPYFEVKSEFDIAFQYGANNPNLASAIKSMSSGAAAQVIVSQAAGYRIPAAAFSALKGKDNYLIVNGDGIQWVFYGKNIINQCKDIDTKVTISNGSGSTYGANGAIVNLKFADNGVLPGKAQIRLKSDYLYNTAGVKGTVFVYYEETGGLNLESATQELVFDGTDKWCHFDISHNSRFILSPKKLKTTLSGTAVSKLTSAKKSFAVKIKKQAGKIGKSHITGYQIKYSTKANMKSSKTKILKGYKNISTKIKKLQAKKKYYVQVRTYLKSGSKTYYSGWSKSKSIKTK